MEVAALILVLLGLLIYFIPALVASNRGRAAGPIFLLNLLLGWTLVGWVFALVWACTERTAKEEATHNSAKPNATFNAADHVHYTQRPPPKPAPAPPATPAAVTLSDDAAADFGGAATTDASAMGRDPEDAKKHFGKKIADNLGWRLALQYRDASGHESARRVDVDALYADEAGFVQYFTGFCHSAQERRTFRPDRAVAFAAFEDEAAADGAVPPRDEPLGDYLRARLRAEHPPEA